MFLCERDEKRSHLRAETYDLIDGRDVLGVAGEEIGEVLLPKVSFRGSPVSSDFLTIAASDSRNSDRLDKSEILRLAATFPAGSANFWSSLGTVNQIAVDIVESSLLQADLDGIDNALRLLLVVHCARELAKDSVEAGRGRASLLSLVVNQMSSRGTPDFLMKSLMAFPQSASFSYLF